MKIDHIAIAVNDVEESAKVYQQALGVDSVEFETVDSEGVKVAIIHLENGRIELMQPTNDSSPIKKFLDKKGQGLHHMALDTGDIEGEVKRMEGCGIQFLGNIRPGSAGTKVTFIHPKSLHGVLAELCSHPE
ncbi:MAG: methylmalonyl-CoA epimerase [Thaumarchaeota archaeon]|jgi:methylmalonyl-CoA/ethylmalonyl-CoA epimerase|nr:methylmalonyl-CoA epimerase [Nitrososphaerota archaeon]MDP6327560.1 methylmalonyl-CoA epimerase [Nitrosopumilus sp.]HJL67513.1 methylmalonyl-CoA epimerase [Nitrosopumilus sp.]HJM25961.1 methylmalonyl-CoA epimerase [Nitrosopumilus sp.]|tara:strand:+ start:1093 stop:1488 length:396 start_codon:yes stop_codon:yes gene_type:complete